jgi:hypothetical protein
MWGWSVLLCELACLCDQGIELLKDQALLVVEVDLPPLHLVKLSFDIDLESFELAAHSIQVALHLYSGVICSRDSLLGLLI